MADKHHAARDTRKKQKQLNIKQRESLGMSMEPERDDSGRNAIYFPDKTAIVMEESIKQNGRIETVKASLDKDSPKHKEYDEMLNHNDRYIEHIKQMDKSKNDE